MLEKVDLTKKISKEEYKAKMPQMEIELGRLQRECRELKIPVMIVFEGFGASGKGVQIGKLIQSMDPRGFQVFPVKAETEEERMHPFLWRFWTKTPEAGRIAIFDGSWYRKVLIDRFEKRTREKEIETAFHSIEAFEKQLTDGGTILVKLLLDIDQKEQKKRFEKLLEKKETAWRVSQGDRERNAKYSEYAAMMEEVLYRSDTKSAPWTVIEATDRRFATVKIYMTVIHALAEAVEAVQRRRMEEQAIKAAEQVSGQQEAAEIMRQAGGELEMLQSSVLSKADLTLAYGKEEYEKRLKKLQKKPQKLLNKVQILEMSNPNRQCSCSGCFSEKISNLQEEKPMASFTAKDVNELRKNTGVGMMDCKKALTEADGDVEKAMLILREKGLATQAKKAGRVAAEGMVIAKVNADHTVGFVVGVNSET